MALQDKYGVAYVKSENVVEVLQYVNDILRAEAYRLVPPLASNKDYLDVLANLRSQVKQNL